MRRKKWMKKKTIFLSVFVFVSILFLLCVHAQVSVRMNEDFFFQEDTTNHPRDTYGERLKLTIEPYAAPIPVGGLFTVTASLKLDGKPVGFMPIEKDNNGKFKDDQIIYVGAAIGAAVVIEDVSGDLDRLTEIEMDHVKPGVISGDDSTVTSKAQKLAVRVVVKMRPQSYRPSLLHYIRTATITFNISGGQSGGNVREDVWLIENQVFTDPTRKFFKARLQRLQPTGSVLTVNDIMLPIMLRSPLNYQISRNGIATENDEGGIFLVHLAQPNSPVTKIVYLSEDGKREDMTPPVNQMKALATSELDSFWLASDTELVYTSNSNMIGQPDRQINNIRTYAYAMDPRTDSLWVAAKVGNEPLMLRRYTDLGSSLDKVVTLVRGVTYPNLATQAFMRINAMSDGGVVAYATYKQIPRLVRISAAGDIIARSEKYINKVVEMGVNPITGEAAVIHLDHSNRSILTLYNAGLEEVETIKPGDSRFNGYFVNFYSVDYSVSKTGTRLWLTGFRLEKDNLGKWVPRGIVGYLQDGEFQFVVRTNSPQTMVRAFTQNGIPIMN